MGIAEISDLAGLLHHTDEFGVGVFGISHPAMKIEDVLVGQLCFEIEAFVSGRRAVGCRDHDLCGRSAGDRREEAGGYLDVVVEPVDPLKLVRSWKSLLRRTVLLMPTSMLLSVSGLYFSRPATF
jgi:hypothetical protein